MKKLYRRMGNLADRTGSTTARFWYLNWGYPHLNKLWEKVEVRGKNDMLQYQIRFDVGEFITNKPFVFKFDKKR